MSAGIELPRKVWVHGWLLARGGERMSKSRGNMLDPFDVVAAFGADGARYVTLREVAFDRDTEVSWDAFVRRYNADLANDFGNLVNRSVTMASRYLDGERPEPRSLEATPLGPAWGEAIRRAQLAIEACLLHEYLASLWEFVGVANRFVEAEAPWSLAKAIRAGGPDADAAATRLRGVLGDLVEACRLVALAAAPVLPSIAPRVLEQLGLPYPYAVDGNGGPPLLELVRWGGGALADAGEGAAAAGATSARLGTPTPLFPRLDSEAVETAPA